MDWGLLQGLGGGLQQAGKMWTEKAKSDLAEKLAKEREERSERREIDKENRAIEREKVTPVGNRAVTDESGNVWMQPINKAGDPVGKRRPADAAERQQHKNQTDESRLSMEKLIADVDKAKFEVGRLQTEAELGDALTRERINTERAQAENYRAAAARKSLDKVDEDDDETFDGAANTLLKKYKDLLETGDDARVSKAEAHSLAREAIEYAIQTNGDTATAEDYFLNAIKSGAKPSKGKVKFVQ